jgi:hypothetical protein
VESSYIIEQLAKAHLADHRAALRSRCPAASTITNIADRIPVAVEPLFDLPSAIARLVAIVRSLARPVAVLGARLS